MKHLIAIVLALCFLIAIPTDMNAQINIGKAGKGLIKLNKKRKKEKKAKEKTDKHTTEQKKQGAKSSRFEAVNAEEKEKKEKEKADKFQALIDNNEGITSPTHSKYQNKIVFSSTPIIKGAEQEANFISTYELGKPLYFRSYTENSLLNMLRLDEQLQGKSIYDTRAKFYLVVYLDGVKIDATGPIHMYRSFKDDEKQKSTTIDGGLFIKPSENKVDFDGHYVFQKFIIDAESKLTEGTHDLKIEIYPYHDGVYAKKFTTGSLKLNVKHPFINPSNTNICLPKVGMRDAKLEASIMEAFKAKGWKEQPQKVVIKSTGWAIHRHEVSGVIVSRSVTAYVASTRGDECIYQSFDFHQNYDGSKYADNTYIYGIGGQADMPCACLK